MKDKKKQKSLDIKQSRKKQKQDKITKEKQRQSIDKKHFKDYHTKQQAQFYKLKNMLQGQIINKPNQYKLSLSKVNPNQLYKPQIAKLDSLEFAIDQQNAEKKTKQIKQNVIKKHKINPSLGLGKQNYQYQQKDKDMDMDIEQFQQQGLLKPKQYPLKSLPKKQQSQDQVILLPMLPFQQSVICKDKVHDLQIKSTNPQDIVKYSKQFKYDSNGYQITENLDSLCHASSSGLIRLGKVKVYRNKTVIEMGGIQFIVWQQQNDGVLRQVVQFDEDKKTIQQIGKVNKSKILCPNLF